MHHGNRLVRMSYHPGPMYARCNNEKLEYSANFKNNSSNDPTHAEARAILKAIKKAYSKWPNMDILFVNTDSLAVCHSMWPPGIGRQNRKITSKHPDSLQIINSIKDFIYKKI
jgi:cytidine deaminase